MNVLEISAMRPRRSLVTQEHDIGDERLVYCPKLEMGISLNRSAIEIWDLCDGERTLLDIAQVLGQRLGIDDPSVLEELVSDVNATLLQFAELGLVEIGSCD